jgi:hypothetical protein
MQPDARSWPVPSLAAIPGTALGAKFLASFFQIPPAAGWNTLRVETEFDAVLYLGSAASLTMSKLSPSLCAEKAYVRMRLQSATERPASETGHDGFVSPGLFPASV